MCSYITLLEVIWVKNKRSETDARLFNVWLVILTQIWRNMCNISPSISSLFNWKRWWLSFTVFLILLLTLKKQIHGYPKKWKSYHHLQMRMCFESFVMSKLIFSIQWKETLNTAVQSITNRDTKIQNICNIVHE